MKKVLIILLLTILSFNLCGCEPKNINVYKRNLFNDGLGIASKYVSETSMSYEKLKYGYFNKKGEMVIDFIYDRAEQFNNGLAIVKKDENYYLINTKGEKVSDYYKFLNYHYKENLYTASSDSNSSNTIVLSNDGKVIGEYMSMSSFDNGIALVKINEHNYGYIDAKGNLLASNFYYAENFNGKYAMIMDENLEKWTIDQNMNRLYNFKKQYIHQYFGYVIVDNKIYDVNGEIIKDEYPAIASNPNTWGEYYYADDYGSGTNYYSIYDDKQIMDVEYIASVNGYMLLYSDYKNELYLYDNKLNLLQTLNVDSYYRIYPEYDDYRNDIYIKTKSNNNTVNYYMFDYSTRKIKRVKFLDEYDEIVNIHQNYISVKKNDLYGLIKLNGKVVFDVKSKGAYIATSDGYIFDYYNKVLYNSKKKKIFKKDDWNSIYLTMPL